MMTTTAQPVEVFCSYAHKDEDLWQALKSHLSSLQRQHVISLWYDRELLPGMDWAREIDERLNSARLILLLISAYFLDSDYCYGIEMRRAMERYGAGEAWVVPVLLRAVDWQDEPISRLQALPTNGRPITSWTNRDEAFTDVAKGLRKIITRLSSPATAAPPLITPPVWNVPFARNPFFSGREDLLTRLSAQLQGEQRAAIGQTQAISGLGGIGKTQLATEYAYRYQQAYQFILWARADNVEALNASYAEIAVHLKLAEKDAQDQEVIVQAVKNWLQRHRAWLLILDNADQPEILTPFLPPLVGGHVLITTRAADLSNLGLGIADSLVVETFSIERSALFLLHRANLLPLAAPLDQARQEEQEQARQISEELGGLPLALDQAGAYLRATRASLATYQQLYRQRRADLLRQRRSQEHPAAVATTWNISFERVEAVNPAAAELLRFCAFLAPDAIPEELLSKGAAHLGRVLAPVATDAYRLNEAIEALRAYSLIERDPGKRALSVHRLVQAVLRDSLPASKRKQWERRAVFALQATFPQGDFENWSICERLLPHALLYANWRGQTQDANLRAASLAFRAGYYLTERGRYAEAERLHMQALALREQQLSPEHPDVAVSLNSLGALYEKQGKYAEAEPMFLRALAIAEKVHGPGHPAVAVALSNLATLYGDQGKQAEVEALYQRALTICTQQLGPDDPVTALYLNNLAVHYMQQKQYAKAEPLLRNALTLFERESGPDHPQYATSLSNLAYLYADQGQFARAEPLFLRALAIEERHLGTEHPDTARNLFNLAHVYIEQGKYTKAEEFLKRALAIYEQTLGQEHPSTQSMRQQYHQLQQHMRADRTQT